MLNLIRMASCVLITNCRVAAEQLLHFSSSGSTEKFCCASLVCSGPVLLPTAPATQKTKGGCRGQQGHPSRACHPHLARGNTHPEHLSPVMACKKGSIWTPSSLACPNLPACHLSFNLNEHFHTQRQKSVIFLQLYAPQFT